MLTVKIAQTFSVKAYISEEKMNLKKACFGFQLSWAPQQGNLKAKTIVFEIHFFRIQTFSLEKV